MNIWKLLDSKAYWSGYLDGVKSRTEKVVHKRTYLCSKNKRRREMIRYYKAKIKELR